MVFVGGERKKFWDYVRMHAFVFYKLTDLIWDFTHNQLWRNKFDRLRAKQIGADI